MSSTVATLTLALKSYWRMFLGIVSLCILASVVTALVIKPTYRAEAVVGPVPDDGSASALGGLGGSLGGLASLAGVSVGKGGKGWEEATAVLRSRHIVEKLIDDQNLIPVLFARGVRVGLTTATRQPTMGDAVQMMQRSVLQIRDDAKTGLVTVSVKLPDATKAAEVANALVRIADAELRQTATSEADAALATLRGELAATEGVEVRAAISRLMEAQLKSKVAATARRQYAFKVIDVAIPPDPDKRAQPTRTVMVLAGSLAGVLLGFIACLMRFDVSRALRA